MEKNETGVISRISAYKGELECMGITSGCRVTRLSNKSDRMTVLVKKDNPDNEIILINSVASGIFVEILNDD